MFLAEQNKCSLLNKTKINLAEQNKFKQIFLAEKEKKIKTYLPNAIRTALLNNTAEVGWLD